MRRALFLVLVAVIGTAFWNAVSASGTAVSSDRGTLVGLDAASGRTRWRVTTGGQGGNLTVSYVESGVVVALEQRCLSADRAHYRSGDLTLRVFDTATGEQLWSRRDAAVSYPGFASFGYLSRREVIPVQTTGGKLEGVKLRTGEVLWQREPSLPATSGGNPAFSGRFGIMGTLDGSLFSSNAATILTTGGSPVLEAWRLRDGRTMWSTSLGSDHVSTFASDGKGVFALQSSPVAPADGAPATDFAVRLDTVSPKNRAITDTVDLGTSSGGLVPTQVVVTSKEIITGSWTNEGRVVAFDRVSGTMRWQRSGLLMFGTKDVVLVRDEIPGAIVALDASSGVELWNSKSQAVYPSDDRTVVVSSFDPYSPGVGTTTALDLSSGKPRWHRDREPLGFAGTTGNTSLVFSQGCPQTSAD
jgi:outer membrane protein assembly factor BamB